MKTTKFFSFLFISTVMSGMFFLTVSQFNEKGDNLTIALAVVLSMIVYLGFLPVIITNYLEKLIAKYEADLICRAKKKAIGDFMDFLSDHGNENQTFRNDVLNTEVPIRDGEGEKYGSTTVYQEINKLSLKFINKEIK